MWNLFKRKKRTEELKSFRPRESQLKVIDPDFPNEYEGHVYIKSVDDYTRLGEGRRYRVCIQASGYASHWQDVDFAWYNSVQEGDKVTLLVSRNGQRVKIRRASEAAPTVGRQLDLIYRLVEHQQVYSDGRLPTSVFEVQSKQGDNDWLLIKKFVDRSEAEAYYDRFELTPAVVTNTYVLK